ncbi:MAG: DUF3570 domain-containing protein [Proteobacteria bacterium]|nr:DUF3570 domain-containing protein [Pseudomonadota bacterium]
MAGFMLLSGDLPVGCESLWIEYRGQVLVIIGVNVLDFSYRYMTDDRDIDSHSIEARLKIPMVNDRYPEPYLRYYTQTEANFQAISSLAINCSESCIRAPARSSLTSAIVSHFVDRKPLDRPCSNAQQVRPRPPLPADVR